MSLAKFIIGETGGQIDLSITNTPPSNPTSDYITLYTDGSTLYAIDSTGTNINVGGGGTGAAGTSGTSGTSGANGANGSSGTSGTSGINGTSGTSGANGSSGTSGTDGTSGTSGANGTSGTSGANGTSGTSGANGTSGTDGTSGTSGVSGTNGTSGTSGTDGTSGTSGVNGTSGTSGVNGGTGPQGEPGFSNAFFNYQADTGATAGDPGLGHIIWNNATQASATSLNVNDEDQNGNNIDIFFANLNAGTTITIQDKANQANYQTWIIGTPVDNTTYWTLPVTLDISTHSFSNNDPVLFILVSTPSGTSGTSGTSGVNGTSGTSGVSGTSGTSGVSGTSGTSGTDGTSGTSGVNGTSGTSGTDGTSGTSGANGTSGTSGVSGTSGTSGTDGTSGTSGANGSSGTSGTSGISITGPTGATGAGFTLSGASGGIVYYNSANAVVSSDIKVKSPGILGLNQIEPVNLTVDKLTLNGGSDGITIKGGAANTIENYSIFQAPVEIQDTFTAPLTLNNVWVGGTGDVNFEIPVSSLSGTSGTSGVSGTSGTSGVSGATGANGATGPTGATGADTSIVNNDVKTANYTFGLSDVNKLIIGASGAPLTFTVPLNSTTAFATGSQIMVARGMGAAAGALGITGAAGVTIYSGGLKFNLAQPYSGATLIKQATDTWYMFGDLSA